MPAIAILMFVTYVQPHARAEPHRFATVPALGVGIKDGRPIGSVHYIAIQVDQDLQGQGPRILFSEVLRGSAVGNQWKEGARAATIAAATATGEDYRNWTVTIKNRSYSSFTEGRSASGVIAVGIMAAWRGDSLRSDVVLTGVMTPQGNVEDVDALPAKLNGAADAHMRIMLIPKGQARTAEWDLIEQGQQRNVTVIEVGSLSEAYDWMVVPH
jgi:predicted S18 family serine protease